MRGMNGRLQSVLRSPLMRNQQLNHMPANGHQHYHHHHRRKSSEIPRMVQFDESADEYRCFCGCFHVKTGTYIIAGIEIVLILIFFLNALLVCLQQKNSYDYANGDRATDYVYCAFIITSVCGAISILTVILLLFGLSKNMAGLIFPHLIVQVIAVMTFLVLSIIGVIAIFTDLAIFYRILNAAPFNEYPGQSTVALPADITVRIYAVQLLYFVSFILEVYFVLIVYNCQRYFTERQKYMRYCMAYSKPMETLNSAR